MTCKGIAGVEHCFQYWQCWLIIYAFLSSHKVIYLKMVKAAGLPLLSATVQIKNVSSKSRLNTHTHTHTTVLLLFCNLSGTTRVSRYQKGKTKKVKTNLDLLEQEIGSGNGICWAICNAYSLRPPARSSPAGDTWSPPIVHTRRVPPCMAQSRLGAFPR